MDVLDLLRSHGIEPKRVASADGGEYASPCPGCGGEDRFHCWPERDHGTCWYCRGCEKSGDLIQFLRDFDGLGYREACERLGVEARTLTGVMRRPHVHAERPAWEPSPASTPPALWVEKATALMGYAERQLAANPAVLAWLASRGISEETARKAHLGWLPGEKGGNAYYRPRESWGLEPQKRDDGRPKPIWIPRGVVIPCLADDGSVARLRIRRPKADMERGGNAAKYVVVSGSSGMPMHLGRDRRAVVVVEAELDAVAVLSAADAAGLDVGALAVLTNRGKPDTATHERLGRALSILVSLDFDDPDEETGRRAGADGWPFWESTYRRARRWPPAVGKDPGEDVAAGVNLADWMAAGLPPILTQASPVPQAAPAAPAQTATVPEAPAPAAPAPAEPTPSRAVQDGTGLSLPVPRRPACGTAADFPAAPTSEPPPSPCGTWEPKAQAEIQHPGGADADGREPLPPEMFGERVRLRPVDKLGTPMGPFDSLRVLMWAGLTVSVTPDWKDFVIEGHERWPLADKAVLLGWVRQWGHWVAEACGCTDTSPSKQ